MTSDIITQVSIRIIMIYVLIQHRFQSRIQWDPPKFPARSSATHNSSHTFTNHTHYLVST